MKKKNKILPIVIIVSILLILSVGAYLILKKNSLPNFITVSGYYDSEGNLIKGSQQSIVNGVEGVKYITLDINVKNNDTVPLNLKIQSLTPIEINNTNPGTELKVNAHDSGKWTTGLIDIEPYEGKTQTFCATILSEKIPSLREQSVITGCINVKVEVNPSGSFSVSLNSSIGNGTGNINPPCIENWACGSWNTCSASLQTRTCTDSNSCGTIVNNPILSQSCVSQNVKFRTNSDGTYASGSWIAYDSNSDGVLECYVYASSTGGSSAKSIVAFTDLYGKEWSISGNNMKLYTGLNVGSYQYRTFPLGTGCELFSSPVSGYSGKEMYA